MKKKVRVMIIEDSPVVMELLKYIIAEDSRLEVVAAVNTAEKALALLSEVKPDIISMDVMLPGMDGLEATRKIMKQNPIPIIIVSAVVDREELNISMNALRAGALSILEKPVGLTNKDYATIAKDLCTQLAIMSEVKVIRQYSQSGNNPIVSAGSKKRTSDDYLALGIVASTGGPNALLEILEKFSADFPVPIFLVQHIGSLFLEGFSRWLEANTAFEVKIVDKELAPQKGVIYMSKAKHHLIIKSGMVQSISGNKISNQCPSGTMLFESMAREYNSSSIGIVLTGMGDDGAKGLLAMKEADAYTITENQSSAVVYGMPRIAWEIGAGTESLDIKEIAPRVKKLMGMA